MFSFFANKLTQYNNHLVDWSRLGELLKSSTHKYSAEQMLIRGIIASCTAISSYLGATQNNEEKTHCSNLQMAIVAGFLGFTISHAIVIAPLIKKRYEMKKECEQLIAEIQSRLDQKYPGNYPLENIVHAVINAIQELSLSNDQRSNASLTWGRRKALLVTVSESLNENNFDAELWKQPVGPILDSLNTMREDGTNRLRK